MRTKVEPEVERQKTRAKSAFCESIAMLFDVVFYWSGSVATRIRNKRDVLDLRADVLEIEANKEMLEEE